MQFSFVGRRSAVLLACAVVAAGASAQTVPGPWTCGTEMYVGRSNASAPTNFFTYPMVGGAAWGTGTAIGTVDANTGSGPRDLNALAYNPRDNYLYAPKRVFVADPPASTTYIGMYRLGKNAAGQVEPVVMSPSAGGAAVFQHTLRVAGLPAGALGAAATFDRAGNYFMVNGANSDVYLIRNLHAAQPDDPAVQAEKLDRQAEADAAWLADGFQAVVPGHVVGQRAITDFAVSPKESTNAQPVLYGMGDKVGANWYLYRYRVDLAGKKVHVSRKLIANMDAAASYMASAAFRRDGKLFLYSADGHVYEVDADPASATKWTVIGSVMSATVAQASDGASCMTSIHAGGDGSAGTPFLDVEAPASGTTTSPTSVLANDTAYLQPIQLTGAEQNATLVSGSWQPAGSSTGPAAGGITLNADGKVVVATGTTPGTYTYEYQICVEPAVTPAGSACDKAQVVVKVKAAKIDAVDNAFGTVAAGSTTAVSIYANDTVAGAAMVPGTNANLKPGSWTADAGNPAGGTLTLNTDGKVTVPPGTPAGNYTYTYEICLPAPNQATCDKATVTLTVPAPAAAIDAVDNDFSATPIVAGNATPVSIFANDTADGAAVAMGTNTALKPNSWQPLPGNPAASLILNNDGTVAVPENAPAGTYKYTYEICRLPGNTPCDTATVTLVVQAKAIAAADNDFGTVAAGSTTASVFANDTVNGAAMIVGTNANLKPGSWTAGVGNPAGGALTLNTDGTVAVPPGTPAGTYTYTYEICLPAPNQATCDAAKVTLRVGAPANATAVPVGAPWVLGLAALGMLGVARRVRQRRK
ncbi:MAG: hypothetical protein Q4A98_06605 [Comamonadaceae bacterium]|nr:hypothetical protein [Comamonadaceae bacterium]